MEGKEWCACRFTVRWTAGPRCGGLEQVGIEAICCLESLPVQDPVLGEFLDRVTKSLADGKGDATAAPQATGATLLP